MSTPTAPLSTSQRTPWGWRLLVAAAAAASVVVMGASLLLLLGVVVVAVVLGLVFRLVARFRRKTPEEAFRSTPAEGPVLRIDVPRED